MPTSLERLFLASDETPRPIRAVFMDCDGVIFDTNRLKCDAFRYALHGAPSALVEDLVAYHMRTGGVSRYLKIERFYRELYRVPDAAAAIASGLARFAAFSEAGYTNLAPRPESLAFADHFGASNVWVISGSDEVELRRVFDAHGIRHRFRDVCGSPVAKAAHLGRILAEQAIDPADALFVGDGGGDLEAARALGVPFVFLDEMSEWKDGPAEVRAAAVRGEPVAIARDWSELLSAAR